MKLPILWILGALGLVGGLCACVAVPKSVVSLRTWKEGPRAPRIGTEETLARQWADLFESSTSVPAMEMLTLVDFNGDEVYNSAEIQAARNPSGALAYRVLMYRRDGTIDHYYTRGEASFDSWNRESTFAMNPPVFGDLEGDWRPEATMDARVAFTDSMGRAWKIELRDTRKEIGTSALLAPVGARATEPTSFPFVFMDNFTIVPKGKACCRVELNARLLAIRDFPLLYEGRRAALFRHSKPPVVGGLMVSAREAGKLPVPARLYGSTGIEKAEWDLGKGVATMEFSPPLPELRGLKEAVPSRHRWIAGAEGRRAVLAGSLDLESRDGKVFLVLRPDRGWSPIPFDSWYKDFRLDASTALDGSWTKAWTRPSLVGKARP